MDLDNSSENSSSHKRLIENCLKKVAGTLRQDSEHWKNSSQKSTSVKSDTIVLPYLVRKQSRWSGSALLGDVILMQVLFPTLSHSGENSAAEEFVLGNLSHTQSKLAGMARGSTPPATTCVKFNNSGTYLAASRSDFCIYVWCVMPRRSVVRHSSEKNWPESMHSTKLHYFEKGVQRTTIFSFSPEDALLDSTPHRVWRGHTSFIRDICWSQNDFAASFSGDEYVRVWHLDRNECLCCLSHSSEVVTGFSFHPVQDRYLLVTSADKKIRMWSLEEKKVISWNEATTKGYFTAVSFTPDAAMCAGGTSEGEIVFYELPGLKYHTQIASVKKSSTKARVNAIEHMRPPLDEENRLLVTTTDSSIRMYNVRDKSLYMVCKGFTCTVPSIRATIFLNTVVISPSEDKHIYFWDTLPPKLPEDSGRTPDKKQTGSLGVFSSLKIGKFVQGSRSLTLGESFLNWERFKLPKCTEGSIPSVSAAPMSKLSEYYPSECSSSADHESTSDTIPAKKPFVLAVGVDNIVYVYINR